MESVTNIVLDLQAPNLSVVAAAKQNDTMSRKIAATLRDGSVPFYPDSALPVIRYAKPDGTVGFYDTMEDNTTPAASISGNVITFILAEEMLTVSGSVYVDVNFYSTEGEKLTAFTFVLQVEPSVLSDGTVVSSDYFNVLTATLAEAAALAADLPTPSSDTPVADSASGSAGTGNGFARGNHSHPINVATSGTPSPDGTGALGSATTYARTDHVHPLNIANSGTPANLGTAANGTSANYARQDHVHNMPSASDIGAVAAADVEFKIYDSVADIGLTSGSATIAGIWSAMPEDSMLFVNAGQIASDEKPNNYGMLEVIKRLSNRGFIAFHGAEESNGEWMMFLNSSNVPTGTWIRNGLATDSGTPTASSGTIINGSNVRRSGNTVALTFGVSGVNVPTSTTKIGSVPSKFAPKDAVFGIGLIGFGAATPTCYVEVTTDGDIRIRGTSAQSSVAVRCNLTWIQ